MVIPSHTYTHALDNKITKQIGSISHSFHLFLLYFSVLCCSSYKNKYIFFALIFCCCVLEWNYLISREKCYFKNGQHHFLYMDLIKQIISNISHTIFSCSLMMKQYLYVHVWWTQMLYVYIYSLNVSKQQQQPKKYSI